MTAAPPTPRAPRDTPDADDIQVPLSALEHYAYCPRQAGLILLESTFTDDAATVRGTLHHQRVDTPGHQARGNVRMLYTLPVWHDGLGLTGICDAVELHRDGTVVPVEHKVGRYRPGGPADLQVAGQALCLEKMFGTGIEHAVVYSAADRRRHRVAVDGELRDRVEAATRKVRDLLSGTSLPPAPADRRCRRCSMAAECAPKVLARTARFRAHLADLYRVEPDALSDDLADREGEP